MRQKSGPVKAPAEQGREGHPSGDAAALLGRGQDPHRAGGPARRGQHRRAVPPRGDRPEPVLPLVEGLPRGRQEAAGGDTARAATSDEVKDLRREASALKEVVAELTLENRLLKKSMIGDGGDDA